MSNHQVEQFNEMKLESENEKIQYPPDIVESQMNVIFDSIIGKEFRLLTSQEAEEEFYKTHDCLSDDVDKEEARIDKWAEENNIEIV